MLTTNVHKRPSIDQLLLTKWVRDSDMIETVHNIMKMPMPHHYTSAATRLAIQVSKDVANSESSVFLRPYAVDVDSENIQPSKKRRLR